MSPTVEDRYRDIIEAIEDIEALWLERDRARFAQRYHSKHAVGNEASSSAKADDPVVRDRERKPVRQSVLDTPPSRSMTIIGLRLCTKPNFRSDAGSEA